jgi:hypothetical protein
MWVASRAPTTVTSPKSTSTRSSDSPVRACGSPGNQVAGRYLEGHPVARFPFRLEVGLVADVAHSPLPRRVQRLLPPPI